MANTEKHFAVRIKRAAGGRQPTQRLTLEALGLRRFGRTVYLKDTPENRGSLFKVVHLVEVEPRQGPPPPSKRQKARAARGARK